MSKKKKKTTDIKISILVALLVVFGLLLASLKDRLQENVYNLMGGDPIADTTIVIPHAAKPLPTTRPRYMIRK